MSASQPSLNIGKVGNVEALAEVSLKPHVGSLRHFFRKIKRFPAGVATAGVAIVLTQQANVFRACVAVMAIGFTEFARLCRGLCQNFGAEYFFKFLWVEQAVFQYQVSY